MGRKYSAEYGLPQYEHVLIPRTKVTYAAIASLKDKIQSVYDICILYTNKSNNLLSNECEYLNNTSLYSLLKLEAPEVHVHLTRIPINTFYNVNNNNNRRELSEEDFGNSLINYRLSSLFNSLQHPPPVHTGHIDCTNKKLF